MLQEQYEDLFPAIDEVAERMRALGSYAPGGLASFKKLTEVREPKAGGTGWQDLLKDLIATRSAVLKQDPQVMDAAEAVAHPPPAPLIATPAATTHDATLTMDAITKQGSYPS